MTTKQRKREDEGFERHYDIGDFVKINGYGDSVWEVDGYAYSQYRYKDEAWDELTYELTCVVSPHDSEVGDYNEAYDEDLTLECGADKTKAYMARIARKARSAPNTDKLLAELSDITRLRKMFGDDEENDYSGRITKIKRKLKRVVRSN